MNYYLVERTWASHYFCGDLPQFSEEEVGHEMYVGALLTVDQVRDLRDRGVRVIEYRNPISEG